MPPPQAFRAHAAALVHTVQRGASPAGAPTAAASLRLPAGAVGSLRQPVVLVLAWDRMPCLRHLAPGSFRAGAAGAGPGWGLGPRSTHPAAMTMVNAAAAPIQSARVLRPSCSLALPRTTPPASLTGTHARRRRSVAGLGAYPPPARQLTCACTPDRLLGVLPAEQLLWHACLPVPHAAAAPAADPSAPDDQRLHGAWLKLDPVHAVGADPEECSAAASSSASHGPSAQQRVLHIAPGSAAGAATEWLGRLQLRVVVGCWPPPLTGLGGSSSSSHQTRQSPPPSQQQQQLPTVLWRWLCSAAPGGVFHERRRDWSCPLCPARPPGLTQLLVHMAASHDHFDCQVAQQRPPPGDAAGGQAAETAAVGGGAGVTGAAAAAAGGSGRAGAVTGAAAAAPGGGDGGSAVPSPVILAVRLHGRLLDAEGCWQDEGWWRDLRARGAEAGLICQSTCKVRRGAWVGGAGGEGGGCSA